MSNTTHRLPNMDEVKQTLKDDDKYIIFADNKNVPKATYEIKRPTKKSFLRDDHGTTITRTDDQRTTKKAPLEALFSLALSQPRRTSYDSLQTEGHVYNIIKQEPQLNVYQMWFATQPEPLWITRTTWASICAKVTFVGEAKGPAPYYGNPAVKADIYSASGQCTQREADISAPGTYKTWRQISEPHWAKK